MAWLKRGQHELGQMSISVEVMMVDCVGFSR